MNKQPITQLKSELDNIFPIPPQTDQTICHDEYLKNLFGHIHVPMNKVKLEESNFEMKFNERPKSLEYLLAAEFLTLTTEYKQATEKKKSVTFRKQKKFEFLKSIQTIAIHYVLFELSNKLEIYSSYWDGDLDEIQRKVFSWSLKDFVARRNVSDFVYLDIMERKLSYDELINLKLQSDLQELHDIVDCITHSILNEISLFDEVYQRIRDARIMLSIKDYVTKPLQEASLKKRDLFNVVKKEESRGFDAKYATHNVLENLEYKLELYGPIEMRYKCRWTETIKEQVEWSDNMKEQEILSRTNQLNILSNRNEIKSICVLNTYIKTVDIYKQRIEEYELKYDEDLDKMENEIQYAKNNINKLESDYQYLQTEVERFKRRVIEIRELKAKLEAEEQVHEQSIKESIISKKNRKSNRKSNPKNKKKAKK